MNAKIKYFENNESLRVEIKPKLKGIVKFGLWFFYTLPFLLIAGPFLWILSRPRIPELELYVLLLGLLIALMILMIRIYLSKIYKKEVLIVEGEELIIYNQFIIKSGRVRFKKDEIENLQYVGREEFTQHPLDTDGFDYLGLGTVEKEVQWLIESGNISFSFQANVFRFGKNVWEDDGHELIEKFKKYGVDNSSSDRHLT